MVRAWTARHVPARPTRSFGGKKRLLHRFSIKKKHAVNAGPTIVVKAIQVVNSARANKTTEVRTVKLKNNAQALVTCRVYQSSCGEVMSS